MTLILQNFPMLVLTRCFVHRSLVIDDAKTTENLAEMPGFADGTGVAVRDDGSVDPSSQLFRASFVGVETGPMVSQVLKMLARADGVGWLILRCPVWSWACGRREVGKRRPIERTYCCARVNRACFRRRSGKAWRERERERVPCRLRAQIDARLFGQPDHTADDVRSPAHK